MISPEDQELINDGYMLVDSKGKKLITSVESQEKNQRIENFESTENAVMVLGYPKAGSHLCLSILDALGKNILLFIYFEYFCVAKKC